MFQNRLSDTGEENDNVISFFAGDFLDNNGELDESNLKDTLPILPLRNTIVFPGSGLPISVGREKSLKLINSLNKEEKYIGLVCQRSNADLHLRILEDKKFLEGGVNIHYLEKMLKNLALLYFTLSRLLMASL